MQDDRVEEYIRQDDAFTTSRFVRDDKERGKGIDGRRRDALARKVERGLEALNRYR